MASEGENQLLSWKLILYNLGANGQLLILCFRALKFTILHQFLIANENSYEKDEVIDRPEKWNFFWLISVISAEKDRL